MPYKYDHLCLMLCCVQLMERHREAQAYLTQPPLVDYAPLGTTNAIEASKITYSWWERLCYPKARQHGRRLRRLVLKQLL
jgi:hypothetical protein